MQPSKTGKIFITNLNATKLTWLSLPVEGSVRTFAIRHEVSRRKVNF